MFKKMREESKERKKMEQILLKRHGVKPSPKTGREKRMRIIRIVIVVSMILLFLSVFISGFLWS